MMQNIQTPPSISIDLKKKRIRIHKTALRSLDSPDYICLMVNPASRQIAIQRCSRRKGDAVKISYSGGKDCEIYSLCLVEQIAALDERIRKKTSLKLHGHACGHGIIEFNLSDSAEESKGETDEQ